MIDHIIGIVGLSVLLAVVAFCGVQVTHISAAEAAAERGCYCALDCLERRGE